MADNGCRFGRSEDLTGHEQMAEYEGVLSFVLGTDDDALNLRLALALRTDTRYHCTAVFSSFALQSRVGPISSTDSFVH